MCKKFKALCEKIALFISSIIKLKKLRLLKLIFAHF